VEFNFCLFCHHLAYRTLTAGINFNILLSQFSHVSSGFTERESL
jgi:hypothetical protein